MSRALPVSRQTRTWLQGRNGFRPPRRWSAMRVRVAWPNRLGRTRVRATPQPSEQNLSKTQLRYQHGNGRVLLVLERTHGLLARMVRKSWQHKEAVTVSVLREEMVSKMTGFRAPRRGPRCESGWHDAELLSMPPKTLQEINVPCVHGFSGKFSTSIRSLPDDSLWGNSRWR